MAKSMTKKMVLSNKRACVEVYLFRRKQVKNPKIPLRTGEDAVSYVRCNARRSGNGWASWRIGW